MSSIDREIAELIELIRLNLKNVFLELASKLGGVHVAGNVIAVNFQEILLLLDRGRPTRELLLQELRDLCDQYFGGNFKLRLLEDIQGGMPEIARTILFDQVLRIQPTDDISNLIRLEASELGKGFTVPRTILTEKQGREVFYKGFQYKEQGPKDFNRSRQMTRDEVDANREALEISQDNYYKNLLGDIYQRDRRGIFGPDSHIRSKIAKNEEEKRRMEEEDRIALEKARENARKNLPKDYDRRDPFGGGGNAGAGAGFGFLI